MGLLTNLLQARFKSVLAGELVGSDEYGNTYYQEKLLFGKPPRTLRRWVLYGPKGVEASNIPAHWFSWLHYTSEAPLKDTAPSWGQPHEMNHTGTAKAHRPPQSLHHANPKQSQKKYYQAWTPKSFSNKNKKI